MLMAAYGAMVRRRGKVTETGMVRTHHRLLEACLYCCSKRKADMP